MNGYDVAQEIKKAARPPRLIAVSGYAQPEDKERSAAAGVSTHLVKPVDFAVLKKALNRLMTGTEGAVRRKYADHTHP